MDALTTFADDASLDAAVAGVEVARHRLTKAKIELEAAHLEQEAGAVEVERDTALEDRAKIEAEKAAVLGVVMPILGILGGSLGMASNRPHGLNPDSAAAGTSIAGGAAQIVLDVAFENRIARAETRVDDAEARLRHLKGNVLAAHVRAALTGVIAALAGLRQARRELDAASRRRRGAFRRLGHSAAAASGGDERSRARIEALIAAVPNVEHVVGRAWAIRSGIRMPAYSPESGHGLWLLQRGGDRVWDAFTDHLGMLAGYREQFDRIFSLWSDRLLSLRLVIAQFGVPA